MVGIPTITNTNQYTNLVKAVVSGIVSREAEQLPCSMNSVHLANLTFDTIVTDTIITDTGTIVIHTSNNVGSQCVLMTHIKDGQDWMDGSLCRVKQQEM